MISFVNNTNYDVRFEVSNKADGKTMVVPKVNGSNVLCRKFMQKYALYFIGSESITVDFGKDPADKSFVITEVDATTKNKEVYYVRIGETGSMASIHNRQKMEKDKAEQLVKRFKANIGLEIHQAAYNDHGVGAIVWNGKDHDFYWAFSDSDEEMKKQKNALIMIYRDGGSTSVHGDDVGWRFDFGSKSMKINSDPATIINI